MSKKQADEKWVVEVRRAHALEHRPGNWCCVTQCDDGQTAITVEMCIRDRACCALQAQRPAQGGRHVERGLPLLRLRRSPRQVTG